MDFKFDPNSPPLCDLCHENPAAIQIVEQKGSEMRKVAMCGQCAAKRGISHDGKSLSFNLPSVMAAMAGLAAPIAETYCPNCGLSSADFQKTGRLGCARCYEALSAFIEPIVRKVQAGASHKGLTPHSTPPPAAGESAAALREHLARAVARENYEEAAHLRDRIRELEKK